MRNALCSLCLLISSFSLAEQSVSSLDTYFDYLERYPNTLGPMGNADKGEIEIVLDRDKIAEIEKKTGCPAGVISSDRYWLLLNDPVKFPSGNYGIYRRILWQRSLQGIAGVAVMAVLPDDKIVLIRNFRHATRSWEYELPRGGIDSHESQEDAAVREVREETGMLIADLYPLGQLAVDSGLTNSIIPLFLAKVKAQEDSEAEDSEAIAAVEAFTVSELKRGFFDGYLTAVVDGEATHIPLRDPFLSFALFQAELRGLLP